jgi:hypothetical protein
MDRRALMASVSGLVLGAGLAWTRPARAQEETVIALREECLALGRRLLARALDGGMPLSSGEHAELRQEEYRLRRALVAALTEMPPDAVFDLAGSLGHVDPELFAAYGVDLVPPLEAIEPYPALKLLVGAATVPVQQPVVDCEPMWQVVLDVAGEAIGIGTIMSDVLDALLETEQLRGLFDEIEAAIGIGDLDTIAALLFRLADHLFTQELIEAVLKRLGQSAGREFLEKLALRCVPFVGPALVFAGLALTVTMNWDRIVRAHECARTARQVSA